MKKKKKKKLFTYQFYLETIYKVYKTFREDPFILIFCDRF